MPVIYIIILTAILTYLLMITTFLLIYVIITGRQQNKINKDLTIIANSHDEILNEMRPLSINKDGIIE